MPNSGLATASNVALVLAIALYALAMLAYALDLAVSKRRQVASAGPAATALAPSRTEVTVLVGAPAPPASAPSPADTSSAPPVIPASPRSRWPSGAWLRGAFALACLGLVLHVTAIVTRGIAEHRVPWGNMYEFIVAITGAAVIALIAASVRFRAYYMGLFVLLPVVLALAVDVVVIYTPAGRLVPALQSYWIAIHVTAMIVAIGMYIFGAVVTVMYLLADRAERRGHGGIMSQLPRAATLDRLSYRSILFAFPAWTFAVIAGAMWAHYAWGRYWGWDPKETWSFITWLAYAAYLHARATAGWRGRRAAYIHLFGFACLIFNLVIINLWVTGLHSYAGLPH